MKPVLSHGVPAAAMLLCLGASAFASGLHGSEPDSFAILQKVRNDRGARTFYPPDKFSLADLPAYVPRRPVSGTLRLWGSNYIADGPLSGYWAEGFRRHHPAIQFANRLKGSATAIPGLVTGLGDLGVSRKVSYEGLNAFRGIFHRDPLEIVAATGSYDVPGWSNASAIVVHRDNPVTGLTLKQLDGIFGAERSGGWIGTEWHPEFARGPEDNIRTWGKAGLTGSWRDLPIHVYGPNLRFSVALNFSNAVLRGSDKWNERLRMYADAPQPDGSAVPAATQIAADLANDPSGITYTGVAKLGPRTKAVPIAFKSGGPCVAATIDTVRDRTYPLVDEVFFYASGGRGHPLDPKVDEFIRYVLSREGQGDVARDGKYLPLTADAVGRELRKLDALE